MVKPHGISLDYEINPNWAKQNLLNVVLQGGLDQNILLKSEKEILMGATKYIEAFNDMKWSNWEEKFMPYKDPTGVLKDTPRPSKKEIEIVKDICTYLYETYGRFPAFSDAMYCRMMVQNHHIDLDFYDNFYPEGSYTENHKNHFALWHPEMEDPFKK